jgi:hypothetical protein
MFLAAEKSSFAVAVPHITEICFQPLHLANHPSEKVTLESPVN